MKKPADPYSTLNIRHATFVIPLVAGIGNALMTEPMIRQLRTNLPEARLVVMAISQPIGEVMRRVDRVEVIVTGSGIKNLLSGVRTTRALSPDIYLVPFPSNRWQYNALARASGAPRVLVHGYPMSRLRAMSFLIGDRVPAERGIHDVVQNLRLLPKLGITPDYTMAPQFVLRDDDRAQAADLLQQTGITEPFIVIHAGSAQTILAEAKRWPTDQYARLVENLRDETGLSILIVEGPDEVGVAQSILGKISDLSHIHSITLRGNLGVAGAMLERSAFYVGTDSGLAHLAAAVGKRAVTLFAPADPDRVCPFGNRDLVVQPAGLRELAFLYPLEATRPKMRPGMLDQIKQITVEQVMEKVRLVSSSHIRTPREVKAPA
ncbi:MAG: glycosyltransferase family 9 protein [Burkholderiales bacterium]|nr:glycosyltransferase family 9 protein [Phycisphaerae bacterium]